MAFWSKKKIQDAIVKYLSDQHITYKVEQGCLTFELYVKESGYSIYPYVKVDEEESELSIIINVRKVEESLGTKEMLKINAFNVASKYFVAKVKDGVILLEYNCHMAQEDCAKCFSNIIESIFTLQGDLDNL